MALFSEVAVLAEGLSKEASRLKKRAAIAEAVGRVAGARNDQGQNGAEEAGRFCLYLAGQPFPEADARRLNAGGALLSKALKTVSSAGDAQLTAAWRRHGDLGAVAYDVLVPPYGKGAGSATLPLHEVATAFEAMAAARTTTARAEQVEALLRRATALEAKYLLKLMLGDMRIGVKQSLIEEGIAVAAGTAVEAVRHAVMLEADLGRSVVRAFHGTLDQARMRLFHPLGFMLASPVETPEEAVDRFTARPPKAPKPKPAKRARRKKGEAAADEADAARDGAAGLLPTEAGKAGLAEDVELEAAATGGDEAFLEAGAIHALLEDKFDGIRAQVHCGDPGQPGRVAIYSRSREDITESFPEIAEAFAGVLDAPVGPRQAQPSLDGTSNDASNLDGPISGGLIFDGEILGWDLAAEKALPFAVLGTRIGRKKVPDELRRTVPVVFMAFDLMYAAGELLLTHPLRERRTRLEDTVARLLPLTVAGLTPPARGEAQASLFQAGGAGSDIGEKAALVQRLRLSRAEMVESAKGVDQGYRDARARSNEGVMLKAAGSAYLPGRRGLAWLKLKRELATLDVVITGAEYGTGKRAQVLSDYTFAVRGPEGGLLNLGKAYQGVTDAEIVELTDWLKAHTLEDFGHFRTVEPLRVIEVAFNNVMRSDRHGSGFALRFPRILRLRDDKPVTEIDTIMRVEEVYGLQPDKPEEGIE